MLATVYEVIARYVFNRPTIWAYEIAYMAMGTNFLLGMAYALREKSHIRIDVVFMHLSPRKKAMIDCIGYTFLMLPFGFWLTWRLGLYALDAWFLGERSGESAWNPVIWPYRLVFFLGFALLTLQCMVEWLRSILVLTGHEASKRGDNRWKTISP